MSLRLDLPPLDEPAYVDRDMWEKVVFNLLSNALKFTFEGTIDVSLRRRRSATSSSSFGIRGSASRPPNCRTCSTVFIGSKARARGPTRAPASVWRSSPSWSSSTAGRSTVDSVEGEGTRVHGAHPPRPRASADRPGRRRTARSRRRQSGVAPYVAESRHWTTPPTGTLAATSRRRRDAGAARGTRILLADDNADMRGYVSRLLAERWDVEAVPNGAAALAAIRRQPSRSRPRRRHDAGTGRVRTAAGDSQRPRLRLTPVILLSARAGEEATTEGLSAGANDYIVKPFSARELLVRVASTLAVADAAREAHAIEEAARRRLYGHFMQAPFPIAVLRGPEHVTELVNRAAPCARGARTNACIGKPLIEGHARAAGPAVSRAIWIRCIAPASPTRHAANSPGWCDRPAGSLEDVYWDFVYAPLPRQRRRGRRRPGQRLRGDGPGARVAGARRLLANSRGRASGSSAQLVENLPELAWTARPDGFIDYYNRGWYEYTGTTPEEMEGWGWTVVHDPAKLDAVIERWQHSIATGEPFEMEFPLRGADGVFRWFLTRVKPLRDDDGRIVRWFGSNTNIDERRRNDDFRETFLGVLGHDLRNPLNTVLMTSRVLTMLPDTPDDIRKRLERITSSGVRMQRMIEQLLDLTRARLTEGIPVTFSAEPVDLGALVTKIVDEMRGGHPELHDSRSMCRGMHGARRPRPSRAGDVEPARQRRRLTATRPSPSRVDLALRRRLGVARGTQPRERRSQPTSCRCCSIRSLVSRPPDGHPRASAWDCTSLNASSPRMVERCRVQSSEAAGTRFTVRLPRRLR